MTELHVHSLNGCTPTPLASYLKALGVLRLVSTAANSVHGEAADTKARGWWERERFHLRARFDRDALLRFFLEDYAPSPIVSPWNAGSGFYYREGKSKEKDPKTGKRIKTGVRDEATAATKTLQLIAHASADRFKPLRTVVIHASSMLKALGYQQAPADDDKQGLVSLLRSNLSDQALSWFDAALALSANKLDKPPLLGTGGNDGNLDFSANYMQRLAELFELNSGAPLVGSAELLRSSLFNAPAIGFREAKIGQFAPGAAGGPNATTGFEPSDKLVKINPWDYVLMLEGASLFAASTTRRLGSAASGSLSYPFTAITTNTDGTAGALNDEKRKSKGKVVGNLFEIWAPLWGKAASLTEIQSLLSEGRAAVDRRPARDGLDFARAVASLGVNRGIHSFERYAFLQRRGDSISATQKGRFWVGSRPKARLLSDLDAYDWLFQFRQYSRRLDGQSKGLLAPQRLQTLALRLDQAIFQLTQDAAVQSVQRVLIILGEVAAYLVSNSNARDPQQGSQKPMPRLSHEWIRSADDDSVEFRVAAALASLGWPTQMEQTRKEREETPLDVLRADGSEAADISETAGITLANQEGEATALERRSTLPMAVHFAPVKEETITLRFRDWADSASSNAVWGAGSLARNMIAVLERRLIQQAVRGLDDKPLAGASPAWLADISAFLEGPPRFDDARCGALLAGLVWVKPAAFSHSWHEGGRLPFAYAALKPLFSTDDDLRFLKVLPPSGKVPVPPGLVTRLRSGDVNGAVRQALNRARSSRIDSRFNSRIRIASPLAAERLAAALLIPINREALRQLLAEVYPRQTDPKEEIDYAV